MTFVTQRRIAAHVLKCGTQRIWFDPSRLGEIKEAITKADVRRLVKDGAIVKRQATGISSYRKKQTASQKRKGRRKGEGSRKGGANARYPSKRLWIVRIRAQRDFLKELKKKNIITPQKCRMLYAKSKGGFFRSRRHIKSYLEEHSTENQLEQKSTKQEATQPKKGEKRV